MNYAQYCRIETKAGGVTVSNRAFIKACHTLLNKKGKSAAARAYRHYWIRQGLEYKAASLEMYKQYN